MKKRLAALSLVGLLSGFSVLATVTTSLAGEYQHKVIAQKPTNSSALKNLPATGTSNFSGTVSITRFDYDAATKKLLVSGVLNGTATGTSGESVTINNVPFSRVPSTLTSSGQTKQLGSCSILTLDIGAININLLGLVIDLAPINLDITAVQGPSNLLGNLLCAVAGLLSNGGPLGGLLNLLNQINAILAGL